MKTEPRPQVDRPAVPPRFGRALGLLFAFGFSAVCWGLLIWAVVR